MSLLNYCFALGALPTFTHFIFSAYLRIWQFPLSTEAQSSLGACQCHSALDLKLNFGRAPVQLPRHTTSQHTYNFTSMHQHITHISFLRCSCFLCLVQENRSQGYKGNHSRVKEIVQYIIGLEGYGKDLSYCLRLP